MAIIRFFKMAAAAIIYFLIRNFNGRKGQDGQTASSYQTSRRSVNRFSIFPRWRPSAILDLRCACLDHPRRVFGGLYCMMLSLMTVRCTRPCQCVTFHWPLTDFQGVWQTSVTGLMEAAFDSIQARLRSCGWARSSASTE